MSNQTNSSFLKRLKDIRIFIFDMDGVLTDGKLLVTKDEEWYRTMNVKDGYALQLAAKKGYEIIIVSGSEAPAARNRLNKLGIENVFFKVKNKKEFLIEYFRERNLNPSAAMYMGDDIPDREVMNYCSIATCPADAVPEILKSAHYISPLKGGEGCVRDVIEMVLKVQRSWMFDSGITST